MNAFALSTEEFRSRGCEEHTAAQRPVPARRNDQLAERAAAAPRTVGEVAAIGSVGVQARKLRDFLLDPAAAGFVGVSLPEEMSVHEVLELERDLPGAVGRELDLIVVNGLYPDRFNDDEAELLRACARRRPWPAVQAALAHHRHARAQAAHLRSLRQQARTPIVTLPFLFVPRFGPPEYDALARELSRRPA